MQGPRDLVGHAHQAGKAEVSEWRDIVRSIDKLSTVFAGKACTQGCSLYRFY